MCGFCTCSKGDIGAFCKHQAAVYHHFNIAMPNLPAITVDSRFLLAKLAFGEDVPNKSYYMPLLLETNLSKTEEPLNEKVPPKHRQNNEATLPIIPTINKIVNGEINTSFDQESNKYVEQIQELIKANFSKYNSNISPSVLSKCLDRLKKVKSVASWESFLSTAGSNISLRHRT